VESGHVLKHKSSSTTAGAVGGKGLLGRKVGLPTLPSATRPTLPSAAQPTLTSATQPTLLSVPQPTLPSGIRPTLSVAPQPTLPSAAHEILHILRQQAAWGQGAVGGGQGHVAVGGGAHLISCSTFLLPLTCSFCMQMLLFLGKLFCYSEESHTVSIEFGIMVTMGHLSHMFSIWRINIFKII